MYADPWEKKAQHLRPQKGHREWEEKTDVSELR